MLKIYNNYRAMNKVTILKVTFYKEEVNFWGEDFLTKVELSHVCDNKKSLYENECDAFDKAIANGHNPYREIKYKIVESNI
jgi:hypothetical protein|nr:MAG TPA: hypothetical protein [Caudoviricetes sp.]DAW47243.1 MAG TPA: hypothetical protein [Caudoviricetes sp.]